MFIQISVQPSVQYSTSIITCCSFSQVTCVQKMSGIQPVSVEEMWAFLGIILNMGLIRAPNPGGILEHSMGERDSLPESHAMRPFPPGVGVLDLHVGEQKIHSPGWLASLANNTPLTGSGLVTL